MPFSLTFTPSGGTYFLGTDGGGGPIYHTPWSGCVTLDIDAILIANGFIIPPGPMDPERGATKISIDLDNTLVAVSQDGTSSVISKKDFGGITIRTNVRTEPGGEPEVPEPAAFVLVGLGLWAWWPSGVAVETVSGRSPVGRLNNNRNRQKTAIIPEDFGMEGLTKKLF